MKKFLFTRFGLWNVDTLWFDYRFALFEAFTLPSVEQNIEDDLYWVIMVNKDMPVEQFRRLNNIVRNSCLRKNVYILEIDFPSWKNIVSISRKFVQKHCAVDEVKMEVRLDSDDMLGADLLKEVEEIAINNAYKKAVITYENGYFFYVHDRVIEDKKDPYLSMNIFLITDDFSQHIHIAKHRNMGGWAEKNGLNVHVVKGSSPKWAYSIFSDSSAHKRFHQIGQLMHNDFFCSKYSNIIQSNLLEKLKQLFMPNYEKILAFYTEFPKPVITGGYVIDGMNPFYDKAQKLEKQLCDLKEYFLESIDYLDDKKTKTQAAIRKIYQECGIWLQSVCRLYDVPYKPDYKITSITSGNVYLHKLCEWASKSNIYILLSTKNVYKDKTNKFYKEQSYVAIIRNGYIDYNINDKNSIEMSCSVNYGSQPFMLTGTCGQPFESNLSSIAIGLVDYSLNLDGINIVVYDIEKNIALDSVNIDVSSELLPLTR